MIDEYLFDRRQHPRLRMVISVRPDNQINLLVRGIALEILRQAKERIRRSSLDEIRRKDSGRRRAHDVRRDRSEALLRRRSGRRWRGRRGKRRRERGRHYEERESKSHDQELLDAFTDGGNKKTQKPLQDGRDSQQKKNRKNAEMF